MTIEEVAACRKRLKIEVPADRVTAALDKTTDEFARQARVPGFRPGHAPRNVVRKRFAKDIEAEMQRTLVSEAYKEAVRDRKLKVVSDPQVEDVQYHAGVSLSFSTLVDTAPEFPLPDYKSIPLEKLDDTITDEDVDKALEQMRETRADFQDVEPRPLQMGDFAIIGYTATHFGQPLSEIEPAAKNLSENPNFWLWMKDDSFLPQFPQKLVGMNIGDRWSILITFPEDFPRGALAGKECQYNVELKQIKNRVLPALDDTLAESISEGQEKTLEGLKTKLRENLIQNKRNSNRKKQRDQLYEALLNQVHCELPESLVEQERDDIISNIVQQNQQRGIPVAALEEKKAEMIESASKSAVESVKINFILGRIAEEEKIEPSQNDLINAAIAMAPQYGMEPGKFIEQLQKNNAVPGLYRLVAREKTVEFLLRSNGVGEPVPAEGLTPALSEEAVEAAAPATV
ncbi:MAG TPA: trigger factor [Candidatus Methylacidiphilales bacterium]|nr:trigger factor [Candidatus Methylacidiphilales bacterium]